MYVKVPEVNTWKSTKEEATWSSSTDDLLERVLDSLLSSPPSSDEKIPAAVLIASIGSMMAPSNPPAAITLRLKVPPGYLSSTDEFLLGLVETTSTIGSLRQRIQEAVPTHPPVERQRLLFAGRALVDNEQTVADALNIRRDPGQTDYVIHLLVKGEGMSRGPSPRPGEASGQHTRGASMPSVPAPMLQAIPNHQDGGSQQPDGVPEPRNIQMPPQHMMQAHQQQHLAHVQRQVAMQQQMLFQQQMAVQQMAQRQYMATMRQQGQALPNFQHTGQQVAAPQQQAVVAGEGNTQDQNSEARQPQDQPQMADQQPPGMAGRMPAPRVQGVHIEGVGSNGQHFQVHQQMLQMPFPVLGMPGQQPALATHPVPNATNGMTGPGVLPTGQPISLNMPNVVPQPQFPAQPNGISALDRARANITELRQLLDEARGNSALSEEQRRQRLDGMQTRIQSLNDYIDPFGADTQGVTNDRSTTSAPVQPVLSDTALPNVSGPLPGPRVPHQAFQSRLLRGAQQALQREQTSQTLPAPNSNEVTAYLLSSPQGPQALLLSPQHGAYTGSLADLPAPSTTPAHVRLPDSHGGALTQYVGAPNVNAAADAGPADPVAQAARQHIANQQNAGAADPVLAPLQPIMAHLWLLLRIMIFAYFLLGTNLGWQRPLILVLVGLGFWFVRMGLLRDGGPVRAWWDGLVGVERPMQDRAAAGQDQVRAPVAAGAPPEANGAQRQAMPTPEQVAQRLLNAQNTRNRERRTWLRERMRSVERAAALFVASLWPGIGEAHVAAREQEQRRLREEAEAETRRAEEEREREKEKPGSHAEGDHPEGPGGHQDSQAGAGGSDASAVKTEQNESVMDGDKRSEGSTVLGQSQAARTVSGE